MLSAAAALPPTPGEAATLQRLSSAAGLQVVGGHLDSKMLRAPIVGVLPASQTLHLSIGLPLRNRPESAALVAAVSDPASPKYRRYLTPAQFDSEFSPSMRDYQAVIAFARASNFKITQTFAHRIVVGVDATVADVERAFHLTIQERLRPDGSVFYAPSNEPALALSTPILHIAGLDNEIVPKPQISRSVKPANGIRPACSGGSGPGCSWAGPDFRYVYATGTSRTGVNQCLGLFEIASSYFPTDIANYETTFSLAPALPPQILLDGYNGKPVVGLGEEETSLDIEVAMAMAPGLEKWALPGVFVFEGNNPDDILAAMVGPPIPGSPICNQLSASWTFPVDSITQELTEKMALQGQSLFVSSGDSGGLTSDPGDDRDLSNVAVVGGTELTINPASGLSSEVAWPGSSGGFVTSQFTPPFQVGLKIGRETLKSRAIPDVAMVADNVFIFTNDGSSAVVAGTSISTPLWAAETALINEEAQIVGQGPLGFPDPALYTIATIPALYSANFYDITSGSNGPFNAVPGYDLVTGWGSPAVGLISTLNPVPTANFTQLQFVVFTGSDNLRKDSDLSVSFTGIGNLAPFCLMRSNNGQPSGACTGNAYGDVNGRSGWPGWSTQTLTYVNRFANWTWAGSGTMTLQLTSHNSLTENNDNWDIQAMKIILSNPNTSTSVTLFNVGNFNAPHNEGTCYWRFKPTGSPPTITRTFKLLPGKTPSNGCPNDN